MDGPNVLIFTPQINSCGDTYIQQGYDECNLHDAKAHGILDFRMEIHTISTYKSLDVTVMNTKLY